MKKLILAFLCLTGTAHAAKILQTKAKSAIIEVTDSEIDGLKLAAGQNIQFTVAGAAVQASVVKVIKNKILVKANSDLTGQQNAQIELSTPIGSESAAAPVTPPAAAKPQQRAHKTSAYVKSGSIPKKPWIAGVNLKYVKGTAKIQFADTVVSNVTVPGFSFNQSTTGFDLSGVGIYYFGQMGAGVELEYATLKGSDSDYSSTVTQMQMSGLGEYKFDGGFSAGVLLTIASNFKASDNSGNDSSLNGMGFGIFGTYQVTPEIRAVMDYKTITYKLDANSVSMADFRIGAGYYF